MAGPIPLRVFRRKLRYLRCHVTQRGGTHWWVWRDVGGIPQTSGFATHKGGRMVDDCYRVQCQRELGFTRKDWDEA